MSTAEFQEAALDLVIGFMVGLCGYILYHGLKEKWTKQVDE